MWEYVTINYKVHVCILHVSAVYHDCDHICINSMVDPLLFDDL
jgi:hypothetical protein